MSQTKPVPTPNHLPETGNCYQITLELISVIENETSYKLVYGRPVLSVPPYCQFGHAWLETDDGMVLDLAQGFTGPKDVYYALGQIDPALNIYYTRKEARALAVKHKHYGPWEGPDAGVKPKKKRSKSGARN
jgi:hypothetical protein